MTECRFDATRVDIPPIDPTGEQTRSFQYRCECERWHWALPDLEADGTADTSEKCCEAILDVLDSWYAKTAGITFRDALASGETSAHHYYDWRPTQATTQSEGVEEE